jgi:hypothetical protein
MHMYDDHSCPLLISLCIRKWRSFSLMTPEQNFHYAGAAAILMDVFC